MAKLSLIQKTKQRIDNWMEGLIQQLPKDAVIGIFGTGPYARYLCSVLQQNNYTELCFLSTLAEEFVLDSVPIYRLNDVSTLKLTMILAGSLAEPENQQHILTSLGIEIPFCYLANGRSLCPDPRFDPCDESWFSNISQQFVGQTFYVIGNGPSLNLTPPEKITSGITMAGNGIVLRPGFRPDFYFLLDEIAVHLWVNKIRQLDSTIIAPSHLFELLRKEKGIHYYPACYQCEESDVDPLYTGVPSGRTIASIMIYFATFMGAKRIVLLGLDNSFTAGAGKTHFSAGYYPEAISAIDNDVAIKMAQLQKSGILAAVAAAQRQGVEVVDATAADNKLGIEKVSFQHIITAKG